MIIKSSFYLILLMANCSHHKSETTFKIDQSKDTLINNNKADSLGFTIEYVMGKFDPKTHPDFIEIPLNYADQSGRLMRKDAFEAFQRMAEQAAKENIKIIIKSSTRNFDYQKGIWERKWKGETVLEDGTKASDIKDTKERALMILKYSSMPGTSRHHWGTDIDINAFENTYFETGDGLKLYNWMLLHAADFGFCQVYDAKGENRVSGYNEEKWHWSYMPISSIITSIASQKLKNEMIAGFLGSEVATKVDMVNNYVLSISKKCYP